MNVKNPITAGRRVTAVILAFFLSGVLSSCEPRIVTVGVGEMQSLSEPAENDSVAVLAAVLESGDSLTFVDGSVTLDRTGRTLSGRLKSGDTTQVNLDRIVRIYMRTDKIRRADYLFLLGVAVAAIALAVIVNSLSP